MIVPANLDGMEGLYLPLMELETEQQPKPENPMSTAAPSPVDVQGNDLGELPCTQPMPVLESVSHDTASQSLADINAKVV